ncbi:organic cation/carnitine transporter 7-like [Panicum miliaceum]|uniref:Organic cation/carnitine transporter 7-like n=1 Tax=Panicum miliaceum TaxID=4540 RepID=A0A3L6S7K8_PANMI|nr:organic cation/carnitine transporter 7-like [Panicum miliaceum]
METYTTDDALTAMGFGKFQALVLVYAGTGWLADSMELMLLSLVGPLVRQQWNVSAQHESLLSSAVFTGMLIGACSWGYISDKYGRRTALLFSIILTTGAGFLSALSPNYISLIVFRFLVGIGVGGTHEFSSWFLEFVPAKNRGTWMIVFFCFLDYWNNPGSFTCMERMAKTNKVALPPGVLTYHKETQLVDHNPLTSQNGHLPVRDNDCAPDNAMSSKSGGIAALRKLFSQFPGLVISAIIVDWFSRKATMWILLFGCCAFLGPLAVHQKESLTTALLFGARACGMGSSTVLCLYAPEVYPTSARSTGVGIATAIGKIGGIVCPIIAVGLLRSCHQMEAVVVFELVLGLAGVACILFPVETKGREMK